MVAHECHKRRQSFHVRCVVRLRVDSNPWPVGEDTRGNEALAGCRVAEDVEDPGGRRVRLDAKRLPDPVSQLRLHVELLEGAGPGDESIPHRAADQVTAVPRHTRRHDEESFCQSPGRPERLRPFARTLDDVDDVPEIDDVRRPAFGAWTVHRVPAVNVIAERLQMADVVALAAAVVEYREARVEQAVGHDCGHRAR